MKKWLICGFLLLQILCISKYGESMDNQNRPEVTFYGDSSGVNTDFHLIFELDHNGRLNDKNINLETVTLSSPSKSVNPWVGFDYGDFIVSIDENKAIVYGNYYSVIVSGWYTTAFKRKGIGEKALCEESGNIYFVRSENENIHIGRCQFQVISTPEGEKRTVRVIQLLNPLSKKMFVLGEKIFSIEKNGQLTQEGWVGWREIITSEGKQLVILMTKGMDANAKWAGRYDGKLYKDK